MTEFDAQDKMAGLTESIRLLERIKEEINGMGFSDIEHEVIYLIGEIDNERRGLQGEVDKENEVERQAEEREYYANCY